MPVPDPDVAAWSASGAMALTGWPERPPLGPPSALVGRVAATAARLGPVVPDPLALLGERAAALGLTRAGRTSCGGSARLLPAGDGWLVLNLARPEDHELLPAWLGTAVGDDPWAAVAEAAALRSAGELVAAADGLGLPVAAVPVAPSPAPAGADLPVGWTPVDGTGAPPTSVEGLRVIDLTSLWAGPLCGSLLVGLGADVVKVESTARPDGGRAGPAPLFDLLHAGKRSVALDLTTTAGQAALRQLATQADVVLEGSRPRALRAMGLHAEEALAGGPRLWVSVTGHGRTGAGAHRVAFGDDAAAAGGLVAYDHDGEPVFCADAVADPLSGLVAAAAVVEAVARGGRWLVDVSMARVSGWCGGPTRPATGDLAVAPPRLRVPPGPAPRLGQHDAEVLGALA